MIRSIAAFTLCLTGAAVAFGQDALTAVGALKLIPPEHAARLARIEGRSAAPAPERWYLVVYDPAAPAGFREFAVEAGAPPQERTVSQFVQSVQPEEVISPELLKLDSDAAYKSLEAHAAKHGIAFTKANLVLRKEGPDAVPVWQLTCLDDADRSVATLTLTATDGTIIAQAGFAAAPIAAEKIEQDEQFLARTVATESEAVSKAGTSKASPSSTAKPKKVKQQKTPARKKAPKPKPRPTPEGVKLERFFGE